jgi:hypothetical protein
MTRHTVAICLAPNPVDCRVLLDGFDISECCTGIEVQAMLRDGPTRVVLHLIAAVEIVGDTGVIEIRKVGGELER